MAQEKETTGTEQKITAEETRSIAGLLRYAVSLNTTVGLVSPHTASPRDLHLQGR